MGLPDMIPVRQQVPSCALSDPQGAMHEAVAGLAARGLKPGARVAITAGSRGICGIDGLIRAAADALRTLGAEPFVVAAMGSHGGGTAEGQRAMLAGLGITEAAVGTPILTGGETVEIGKTTAGLSVYFNRQALEADEVLVINRVKPHTSFHGPLESGLVKMLVVGLGGPAGAKQFHSLGARRLSEALGQIGAVILGRVKVLGGIAVLEDGREQTADLVPVRAEAMLAAEPDLLRRARALLPRLPMAALDLLVVEEMGKNISGTGMDTNVIGRVGIHGVTDGEPDIQRIVVLDLTEASHGNANGMGLADFITERFRRKIDFQATYMNSLTATFVQRARMPMVLPSDQAALEAALQSLGNPTPEAVRIARIRNTLQLDQFWVSPAVAAELAGGDGAPAPWRFDGSGNLISR